jgi:hypothetical protein
VDLCLTGSGEGLIALVQVLRKDVCHVIQKYTVTNGDKIQEQIFFQCGARPVR